ncbi:hypothetical protein CK503_13440 [Aliifodinibius salipaludis]|uniref:Uncharacterized protein n=1 Tax=Fodinibius salipaludis TaxID=2032627 RepID=A0A2A2G8K5_9BACT|nr:hypothetical protein [Aliifodinibius salipaludis]PAU93157.1 hypothetical protein CK503_13440 [Aliifodinibius salipaludis]
MKHSLTRNLKIKINSRSLSPADINSLEQWENEGGMTNSQVMFLASLSPLRKGEIFEVTGGDIHFENGQLYYEAEINILALP